MTLHLKKIIASCALSTGLLCGENSEVLDLDVISYKAFIQEDPDALKTLVIALHEKGIVGISGIPGYRELAVNFVNAAREFAALPEEVKEQYVPNRAQNDVLGYEKSKEKFQRPDGSWVIDDLKVSYYANIPDHSGNRWPAEVDLKTSYQALGALMAKMSGAVMRHVGLVGPQTGLTSEDMPRLGRMLYYRKSTDSLAQNPFWCGAHFDHSVLTTLMPALYFLNEEQIPEPEEAGLFVRTTRDGVFKKVIANDLEVMMFQVGEFGQLITNDTIRATEHRVGKAEGNVERFTMAMFSDAPMDMVIRSTSVLTKDSRYGEGETCSYHRWNKETYKRFYVKDEDTAQ